MGMIFPMGDPAKHFWLTRSVARSMGVSFSEAMSEGLISAQGYAELVTRCRKCNCVDKCENWLAKSGISASHAPSHCPNASVLDQLKPS